MPDILNYILAGIIGGIIAPLALKIVWHFFMSGRAEKGVYMLTTDCDKRQSVCNLPALKKEVQDSATLCSEFKSATLTRLQVHDQQMLHGQQNFSKIVEDISQIKQTLASMPTAAVFNIVKDDISLIFQSMARIEAVVEFALEKKTRTLPGIDQ